MARPKLIRARMLNNHGVKLTTEGTRNGVVHEFVRPDGALNSRQAAKLLGTYPNMLCRMARAGRLTLTRNGGRILIPVAECRRLLALPAGKRFSAAGGQ